MKEPLILVLLATGAALVFLNLWYWLEIRPAMTRKDFEDDREDSTFW